jgi:hypothetical protein
MSRGRTFFPNQEFCLPGYNTMEVNRIFGGIYRLQSSACYLLYAGFLLGLLFDPDDGNDMFLRNVGSLPMDYIKSQKIKFFITTAVRTSIPTFFPNVGTSQPNYTASHPII